MGNGVGKKIKLKSNVYGNYFGLRHSSGTYMDNKRIKRMVFKMDNSIKYSFTQKSGQILI